MASHLTSPQLFAPQFPFLAVSPAFPSWHSSFSMPTTFNFLWASSSSSLLTSSTSLTLQVAYIPRSWIATGRRRFLKAVRRKNLRQIILNIAAYQDEDVLQGAEYFSDLRTGTTEGKLNIDKVLALGEGMCIVASAAACIASAIGNKSQATNLVTSSTTTVPVNAKSHDFSTWQVLPLLAALLINTVLRARQWRGMSKVSKGSQNIRIADSTLDQRVSKLEEDVGSAITIIRMLSRQLEKLGVRFRVTRQTLRDPIQETATLAQKTSETVIALAAREDMLEKEIEELQRVLLAMQENQVKQLELIAVLGKAVRGRPMERADGLTRKDSKNGKDLEQHGIGNRASSDSSQKNIIRRIGGLVAKNIGFRQAQDIQGTKHVKNDSVDGVEAPSKPGLVEKRSVAEQNSGLSHNVIEDKVDTRIQNSVNTLGMPSVSEPETNALQDSNSTDSAGIGNFLTGRKVTNMSSAFKICHAAVSEGPPHRDAEVILDNIPSRRKQDTLSQNNKEDRGGDTDGAHGTKELGSEDDY